MNYSELEFRIKTASRESIIAHLNKCANSFIPPLHTHVDIDKFGEKIFNKAVTFEAWDKNILVALIAAYYNNMETRVGFITSMSVLRDYRGVGLAARLLKNVIGYGRASGFIEIEAEINIENRGVFKFVTRQGFVPKKQNKGTLTMSFIIRQDRNE